MDAIKSIPIISIDGEIEIDSNDLPKTCDLLPLLKSAPNPLSKWIILAKLYHDKEDDESFIELLETAIPSASLDYDNSKNDRLLAYNLIAFYYLSKANQSQKSDQKAMYLELVRNILTSSEVLTDIDKNHIIGNGYLSLLSGKQSWPHAEDQFKIILEQDNKNFVAIMGMGYLSLARKDYTTSLNYFRRALQICPQYANDARYGIGVCQYKLGRIEDAKNAFHRTIIIDPNHVGALLSLAIIKTTTFDPQSIKEAMGYFKKVYDINKRHPTSLNYLANHFFFKKEYDKAQQLATIAFDNSDNDYSRSESSFQIGRIYHIQGNITEAFQYYHKAIRFNKLHHIASYNLGQIHISKKEYREAYEIFNNLIKCFNTHDDISIKIVTLYLSVILCRYPENITTIQNELKHIQNTYPKDIQLIIVCGELVAINQPKIAIAYYINAIRLMENSNIDVPFELYNNIAVCYFRIKQYDQSLDYMNKAYNIVEQCSNSLPTNSCEYYDRIYFNQTTALYRIKYNIGRIYELKNNFKLALSQYLNLITSNDEQQKTIDNNKSIDIQTVGLAMIRIAHLCELFGRDEDMISWMTCSRVVYQDDICQSAYHLGNYFLEKRDLLKAQQQFEIVLKIPSTLNDSYSLVALGNIWLKTASGLCNDPERKKRLYLRALSYYKQVLQQQPHNIYAANGIGCVFAYQGNLRDSRDIFSLIRETNTESFHFVYINLGNVHFKLRHYIVAIQMYMKALEYPLKSYDVAKINFFIARAYFYEKQYDNCIEKLSISIHLFPNNCLYVYNLALVLLQNSIVCMRNEKATISMVKNAITHIEFALRSFIDILENHNFEKERCHHQIKICNDTINQSHIYLQRASLKEKEIQHNKLKYYEALEEIRLKNESIKLEQLQLEEKKKQEIEEKRKNYLEIMQSKLSSSDITDSTTTTQSTSSNKSKKTRKYPSSIHDNNVDDANNNNNNRSSRKRRITIQKKKYKSAAIVEDDESSDDNDQSVDVTVNNEQIIIDEFPMDISSSDSADE